MPKMSNEFSSFAEDKQGSETKKKGEKNAVCAKREMHNHIQLLSYKACLLCGVKKDTRHNRSR